MRDLSKHAWGSRVHVGDCDAQLALSLVESNRGSLCRFLRNRTMASAFKRVNSCPATISNDQNTSSPRYGIISEYDIISEKEYRHDAHFRL
jgi:hypothetical protein